MALPNLPVNVPTDQVQEDGYVPTKPIYQTHRGKLPEQHEDKRPYIHTPAEAGRYVEEE